METFKDYNVTRVAGKLDNGIPVILFNRPNTPIAIQAVLKSGSKYDSENNPGTAHFMEHMIVNGSKEFPSKDLLAEHIESVGGSMGAMTGQELMWVNTEISDEADLDRAIDVFKASLCNPLFDEKVFENEKNVVIKEIQRSHSNPATFAAMNALELFFKGSAYGHPVLGNEDGIKSLVYQNSLFDRKKLFDKSRIVFVASGDVSFEKLIIKLNQLIFSSGEVLNPSNDNFTFPDEKQRTVYFDAPQTHIHFGVPAPVSYTPEATYMSILGEILAGGRASRLTKRLRYEKGLVYGVFVSRSGGINRGAWKIVTDTTTDKVQELINEIVSEIKNLRKDGVNEHELEFIKNRRIKSLKRAMQTSYDWVNFHSYAEVCYPVEFNIETWVRDTKSTTISDIKKIIDSYFLPENWKLLICGRNKDGEIKVEW